MDTLAPALLALAAIALVGCSDEPPAKPAMVAERLSPPVEDTVQAERVEPVQAMAPAPPPTVAATTPERAPGSVTGLRAAKATPEDLQRWLKERGGGPELRVVMLQDLQAQSEAAALETAIELASAKTSDRLVRANAVALLARSQDPRAGEALAALPEKYQRLAKALRKTQ